jgi:uncharacterized membrane-anchored protein
MTVLQDPHDGSILVRVAEASVMFWAIKALSTALGESASDYLVVTVNPVVAVLAGFAAFLAVLVLQLTRGRYIPWAYWLTVVMVGIFGTMAADVAHVALGLPYPVTSAAYALALAAVLWTWHRLEGTLDVHEVTSTRRELFYWATVVTTFATGTAVGDMTATTLNLGYGPSILLFAAAICVPAIGWARWNWNPVASFWAAYVLTRPLGASVADWTGKPHSAGGLGWGDGPMSLVFAAAIAVLVLRLSGIRTTDKSCELGASA